MTPAARLMATLELLEQLTAAPRPADGVASAYFRARRYIGSHDRAAIATMFYDILRYQGRLAWWVEKKKAAQTPRMVVIGYLALVAETPPAIIDELFSGGRFAAAPLTDDERAFLTSLKGHTPEHPAMSEAVRMECPPWAAAILQQRFGSNFVPEMTELLEPAPLDIRVNSLKGERDAVLHSLKKQGLAVELCRLSPLGIRVQDRPSLAALDLHKNGVIEIQDEGSQLVAMMLEAKPGERIVDFCAGAGGKTLALATQMQNKGNIIACDVLANRLKRGAERFRRAGLHNIETRALETERDPWVKKHKEKFDRVLIDAPCTGTGTWRRNPDARWRELGPGLQALLPLQSNILDSASRLVKKGGRLVYATCSLLPDENEIQVEKFLARHPDFIRVDYHQVWEQISTAPAPCHGAYLSLTPRQHGTDGFFAAILERKVAVDAAPAVDTDPVPEA